MRILTVHNYYQITGGEEQVFQSESALLEKHGHQVYQYTAHNEDTDSFAALTLARKTLWNHAVYQDLRSLIQRRKIQIVHFHNTFPLISPAAYYAARAEGISVIQTCHNYRLVCPNGLFLRNGKVCEDCLGQAIPWSGAKHGCYRGSQAASAATVAMITLHRALKTWSQGVSRYIALTEFARSKLVQGGIPAEKIVVKPNFVEVDPGLGTGEGGFALYAGRLSVEKGIGTLLSAWQHLGNTIPLKIVGDGPLASDVAAAVQHNPAIEWLGRQPLERVYELLKQASFLVFPSEWYEGLPRVLIESFATGTPVIASNLGSMGELITPGHTGFRFQVGNPDDLIATVKKALAHPQQLRDLRSRSRLEFEANYQAESNYRQLMQIYWSALGQTPGEEPQPNQVGMETFKDAV